MRLALLGGTFDPPHNGHLALCLYARELLRLDRLIISVSNNPLKDLRTTSGADRLAMAGLLARIINNTGRVAEVTDWELSREGLSYTIDHVVSIEERYGPGDLFLLIGEDNYRNFHLWKSWEELARRCTVVVFGRSDGSSGSEEGADRPEHGFRVVRFKFPLSSTEVRDRLRSGSDCSGLIPSSILDYIHSNDLYRTP